MAKTRIALATLMLSQDNRKEARALAQKARQGLSGQWEDSFPDWLRPLLEDEDGNVEDKNYQGDILAILLEMTGKMIVRPSIRHGMNLLVLGMNRFLGAQRGCLLWSNDGKVNKLGLQATRNISREEVFSESFNSNMELILKLLFSSKNLMTPLIYVKRFPQKSLVKN